jgi:hypothetical protein
MFQTPGRNVLFPPFAIWTHERPEAGYLFRGECVWGPAAQGKQGLWDRISKLPAPWVEGGLSSGAGLDA